MPTWPKSLREEFLNAFVRPHGFTVSPINRAEFAAHMAADYERWGKMVAAAGLQRKNTLNQDIVIQDAPRRREAETSKYCR